ncbi:MAG TPA: VOC family protein [Polyangiaceae bacterium LLY-WYZ-15_(1-7)]|nr:glyoxalase [Myxococcales bacterium]MAT28093.1 glyoxalase [Sandaracinus sp.]HJL00388.1 VOC family protein [Polyangiaceae bacterium LLY-WYZ-15_(1-7)]MBJ70244.1 glyoxalase [Sandaracinus sp.]HJL11029.1 VOC family protein [Polyangiaceae bacterium LLY-WYZ-15_(1-7)]
MRLTTRLIVKGADAALAFYREVFGAELLERYVEPEGGAVVHAALRLEGGTILALAEANPGWENRSPEGLGGSPVILSLEVDDVDGLGARMVEAGAEVVFPIADQFYGKREGRLRDPFGHLWILSTTTEELSPEEIERRMAAMMGG